MKKIKNVFFAVLSFLFGNKLFLSFSSFYLFLFFYALNNSVIIFDVSPLFNYIIYFMIGFGIATLSFVGVLVKKKTDHQSDIKCVRPNEFAFIPIYLGLIIISLSLDDFTKNALEVGIFCVILFLIWLRLERVTFFSFFWLFFGYRFYEVSTSKGSYTLISRRKDVKDIGVFNNLSVKRVNNFTFLEVKQND